MTLKLYTYIQNTTDPYENLAVEEILRRRVLKGEVILYLWQNADTVVIGRNQSLENECNLDAMALSGTKVARRMSGGGAVYHDIGNQNFSFLACDEDYDKEKQNRVILEAVRSFGISAKISGRNDLLAEGKKFSGHAYYKSDGKNCHHGTIMIAVDQSRLSDCLNVSETKLAKRSVASVRSRVINLKELNSSITREEMREKLLESFAKVYEGTPVSIESLDAEEVRRQREFFADEKWLYGARKPSYKKITGTYPWGEITLHYLFEDNKIKDLVLYSDGLAAGLLAEIPHKLIGCVLSEETIRSALKSEEADETIILNDIANMISSLL